MKTIFTILFLAINIALFAQVDTSGQPLKADTANLLQAVFVNSAVSEKLLKQQPINVSVINAKPFYNTNISGLDLLKQVSGIKVKQDGGLGSRSEFFINGSTGKQVKFFLDGLPQDNLGESQLLNIYPVEQIERIEVYKGVLPVELGADALGAAINIVTRKEREDYFDASYSIASFNTHKLNLSGKKYLGKHFFAGIQVNADYAQNDYSIDAEVPNAFGNVETKQVDRFHDIYKNYNLKFHAGFVNTIFADQLLFSFTNAGFYRQLQNNVVATQPYGNAFYRENLWSGIVKYQKNNLFKNFNLSSVISYNSVNGLFMDTSKNVYNWEGTVVDRKFSGGEITSSGSELHIFTDVTNAKLTASYLLKNNLKLVFSDTYQNYSRNGKDTVAQKFYNGIDFFGTPSSLSKNIAGMGLEGSLLDTRLKFSTSVKHYFTHITGYEIEWSTQTITTQTLQAFAYNAALAYNLCDKLQIKTAFEHAARLPEATEAFGDLMFVRSNPKINIERSDNINLNLLYNTKKLEAELTGFYRNVNNIIYLRAAQTSSQYQNLLSVRVHGIEGNLRYRPLDWLGINANFTFQDLRNQSVIDNSGINNERYKNARMPNIPYLFANGGITYKKADAFKKNNIFQAWWSTSYTHEYYLYWAVDGARELKNTIPMQLLQYAGVSYNFSSKGISLALEANNLTNAKTYDNFKVQLPGRSFSFKIRIYRFK